MNVKALVVFLVLLGGLLAIPTLSYGVRMVLHWSRIPELQQILITSAGQTAPNFTDAADQKRALDRFDDDGGNQIL